MVTGRRVHRRSGCAAVHVALGLLQSEVARQVADVAFETIEHDRRYGVVRRPPGRDDCCGTCVKSSPHEADPFISSDALSHPGLTGPEHQDPATAQIHPLQLFRPQPPVRPFGRELKP